MNCKIRSYHDQMAWPRSCLLVEDLPVKTVQTFIALSAFLLLAATSQADTLGTAGTYAVLGASTVTNTGSSVLSGDLGLAPGTSITGFPPGTVINGVINQTNTAATTAQTDATNFYNYLIGLPSTGNLSGQDLGNMTLTPGVYTYTSSAGLTGPLMLNFEGQNNANIVLQIDSTLTTANASTVSVENLGTNDNVYYAVGSSATLGTYSTFLGDIIAMDSVTLTTGANITCGSAIALTGAVTLDTNNITNCSASGSDVSSTVPTSVTPEPGALVLLSTGLLAGAGLLRRRLCI